MSRGDKVISLTRLRDRRSNLSSGQDDEEVPSNQSNAFYYTLDLLMEDFGKKHQREHCALCEPMKVMGLHRDEVMVRLNLTLFTTFFPSFEEYLLEMKDKLMEGLLKRRAEGEPKAWQARVKKLVQAQIEEDVGDFLGDIQKHLIKYSKVKLENKRRDKIFLETLTQIQKEWMSIAK